MSGKAEKKDLIDILESFNRKERFFLLAEAMGKNVLSRDGYRTMIDEGFLTTLCKTVCAPMPNLKTDKIFVGMDYHLNWVHCSLVLAHNKDAQTRSNLIQEVGIEPNQQDIDLLVAYKGSNVNYHLIFVEAKGYNADGLSDGLSSFTNGREKEQLRQKTKRLQSILNPKGIPYPDVRFYFCAMTGKTGKETAGQLPVDWSELELSLPDSRLVVKYDASIIRSGNEWKGKRLKERELVPPCSTSS